MSYSYSVTAKGCCASQKLTLENGKVMVAYHGSCLPPAVNICIFVSSYMKDAYLQLHKIPW